jgi:hypothetical protein
VTEVVGVGIVVIDDAEYREISLSASGCGAIEAPKEVGLVAAILLETAVELEVLVGDVGEDCSLKVDILETCRLSPTAREM